MRQRTELPATDCNDWATIRPLLGWQWDFRIRIGITPRFMALAKLANIGVPIVLKYIVEALTINPDNPTQLLKLPLFLLVGYGVLRLSTSLFNELRNAGVYALGGEDLVFRRIQAPNPAALKDSFITWHSVSRQPSRSSL